ncbi:CD72 protein, partial [Crypturellus soui]|nr:CD72 protein [Crypturellus soui]
MAQSVVYADLRFAKAPAACSPPCQASETGETLCEDEAESPYENVQPGKAPAEQDGQEAQPAPGPWYQRRAVPAGLLAACLLLLATLLTVGLCHWQVTRRLQDASHSHADERGRLSQQVSLQEQSLEQTQLDLEQTRMELAQARAELQRAWLESNSSRRELENRDVALERLSEALEMVEKELQDVQARLNTSESTVSSLRACVQTGCCPSGGVLYRGKCLFISIESKTWKDSKSDCERQSARLLVQEPWESLELPVRTEGGCGRPG